MSKITEVNIIYKDKYKVVFESSDEKKEIIEVPICQKCQCFKWENHDEIECKRKQNMEKEYEKNHRS